MPFRLRKPWLLLCLIPPVFAQSRDASALSPMRGYFSLVAGESSTGHQDGPFDQATFNNPWGLAIDKSGSKLYVSDRDNHCIRVVDLDHQNQVTTLTGRGQAGYQDGSLGSAAFKSPTSLAFIPPAQLAVNDSGNHRIRLIDLEKKSVTTAAGNGQEGVREGPALQCPLGLIWSLAYLPADHSLYFSEPSEGALQKLDIQTGEITTVFKGRPEIPHPQALCVWRGRLCFADRDLRRVFQLNTEATGRVVPEILAELPNGQGGILALTGSSESLYALLDDPKAPLLRVAPSPGTVHFLSVWGDTLPAKDNIPPCFEGLASETNIQFVEDPRQGRCFYIPSPHWQCVFSFLDYFPDETIRASDLGMVDYDYPAPKPPNTFRILMVGDSQVMDSFAADKKKRNWTHNNLMYTLSKRLELSLNTLASLEDVPTHFEVLVQAKGGTNPLFLWPYYLTPDKARKYDVDLVLYLFSPHMFTPQVLNGVADIFTQFSFQAYFMRPLSKEGIPVLEFDPNYALKPSTERISPGLVDDFFKACQKENLARIDGLKFWFADFNQLVEYPEVEKDLVQLIGKPIRMLREKISEIRTPEGKTVPLYLGILPTGQFYPMKAQQPFWKDLGAYVGAPVVDFSRDFTPLRLPCFPVSDRQEYDHWNAEAYTVKALILAHELISQKIIPWAPSVP